MFFRDSRNVTLGRNTVQKISFSIKDFFSKCDQIRSFLRIWSHLLKKSLMENFIFCIVKWVNESQLFLKTFRKINTSHNFISIKCFVYQRKSPLRFPIKELSQARRKTSQEKLHHAAFSIKKPTSLNLYF